MRGKWGRLPWIVGEEKKFDNGKAGVVNIKRAEEKGFMEFFLIHSSMKILYIVNDKFPVKNVTWILMGTPCHFMSQIDGKLVQTDIKIHDYSMSFIQVLFVFRARTWHGFWTSSSHGISMAFAKKMMGFPSNFVSF